MQVFVYEYLSGGGLVDGDAAATAVLMPQGLAMRDALVADLLASGDCDVTAATCVHAGALPARRRRGGARTTARRPRPSSPGRRPRHDAVWIVAPETGGLLAQFERAIGAPRWLGCDARSHRARPRASAPRCATSPRTAADAAGASRRAAAALGRQARRRRRRVATRVHAARAAAEADLAAAPARGDSACLEPWVEGEALSLSLLCEPGRAELLSVNRQRITTIADGALRYDGVEVDVWPRHDPRRPALAALAARGGRGAARAARLRRHRPRLARAARAGGHRDQPAR